ncbi:hypothetical protein XMIN_113 [Xanthomonas citri pv. mangiferaeindicae LMG 941]|nr:hypothetical protein XMIN_113 [Xanthomonas citri pv. mangiferaeindicae LMG 941]
MWRTRRWIPTLRERHLDTHAPSYGLQSAGMMPSSSSTSAYRACVLPPEDGQVTSVLTAPGR